MVGKKWFAVVAAGLALGVAACGEEEPAPSGGASAGGGGGGEEPYIAIVSKGFQHQFWQAVKQGAEEEAKAQGAKITFEGPPTEQDIEQQVTMLTNAIQKKPAAIGFAALDSKASAPLMDQAKAPEHPGDRVRLRRGVRRARSRPPPPTTWPRPRRRRSTWSSWSAARARWR